MGKSITSANSSFSLSVDNVFATPQVLSQYSTDRAFEADDIENAQVEMGVDGKMSAGWLPKESSIQITLQANSPSGVIFDTWYNTEQQAREKYFANGVILLPSIGRKLILTNGVMSLYKPIAPAEKTLRPRNFRLTFESIFPAAA